MTKRKQYRILLIGSSSPHIANHLDRILSEEFLIRVITNNNDFIQSSSTIAIVNFSLAKFWNWLITPWKIRKAIRHFKPDVIHVHQANSVGFYSVLANSRTGIPLVLTAWGSDILINPTLSWFHRWMTRKVLKSAKICTSDSSYMADEMKALVPNEKLEITICNFGVPESSLPIQKEKIIYSNRSHNPLYRIDKVIRAFRRFLDMTSDKDWRLLLAGKGSMTAGLIELVQELNLQNKVEFIGFVDTATNAQNYAKSSFFISIPESDATAMSLLEAMYYKCTPILSDLPANREWVTHMENGFIVSNLDSNFIIDAMQVDIHKAGDMNREIILQKGTEKRSRELFREVLFKAMNK